MKKYFNILISVLFILSNHNLQAAPFDTGMIRFYQPDETTFIGRIWGDEFFNWAETEDGYRFIQSGDGWYYYAQLNEYGEFTTTEYRVGIDEAPSESYQLERTQSRINEITDLRQQYRNQIENNKQWYAQRQVEADALGQSVSLKVGIILIEFPGEFGNFIDPLYRPNGYLKSDFENMMFSENGVWFDTTGITPHPENEKIYGSFKDYWYQISRGKLIITGRVANNNNDGVIVWLLADHERSYYADPSTPWDALFQEAIQKALSDGLINQTDPQHPNYFDNFVILYSREAIASGALMVRGWLDGRYIILAERSGPNLFGGGQLDKSFTHIGPYTHEFGHNIGFLDEYCDPDLDIENQGDCTPILNFCLMDIGTYNGPNSKGECPATLSAYNRIEKNWVTPILIDTDQEDFLVEYSYENPNLYRINPINATNDEHYIIETKSREGFDLYIPDNPANIINQPGRLLVWHHNIDPFPFGANVDRILIKPADDNFNSASLLTDFFPSMFIPNYQNLSDITTPASTLGKVYYQIPLVTNERTAHFTLNGIKLQDNNTLIEEIILHDPLRVINRNAGSWQAISVPHGLTDYTLSSVLPTCSSAFKFVNNNYVNVSVLENGLGYWASFPNQPQTLSFSGLLIDFLEIPVVSGWNLKGSIPYRIPRDCIYSEPPGIIESIYEYANPGGYILMTQYDYIKPGLGYWIKTTNSGTIFLERHDEPCTQFKITSDSGIDLSRMDKFIVTNIDGYSQTLYVTNTDVDSGMVNINLELPPFFSELNFDSRFEYNEYVKKVSADSGTIDLNILVHTSSYPVSLTWELNPENGIGYSFTGDSTVGKILNIETNSGKKFFKSLENNKIKLYASANKTNSRSNLPAEFALEQNFPNPFNPTTNIKFSIPKQTKIKLNLYNILGELVQTITEGLYEAGYYEISLNAQSLPSGVYIYRIESSKFIQSKKMILLK